MYYSIIYYPDNNGLFSLASEYGKKIIGVSQYQTLWAVVIRWQDVRPINPGNFGGVSKYTQKLIIGAPISFQDVLMCSYLLIRVKLRKRAIVWKKNARVEDTSHEF